MNWIKCRICEQEGKLEGNMMDVCVGCEPLQIGGGNGVEIFDDGDYDVDAFKKACYAQG